MATEALRSYLRTLRVAQHITQSQLAAACNVREELIAAFERGIVGSLKDSVLIQIAGKLHALLDDMQVLEQHGRQDMEAAISFAQQRLAQLHRPQPLVVRIFGQVSTDFVQQVEQHAPLKPRPGKRVYEGWRCRSQTQVLVNDQALHTFDKTAFAWGHSGSGTLTLAQAMILTEFGKTGSELHATSLAQDVLATIPADAAWVMEGRELWRWAGLSATQSKAVFFGTPG